MSVAEKLQVEHRLEPLLVLHRRNEAVEAWESENPALVLEDYGMALDVFRPSALRLLARTLAAFRPLFAISEVAEGIEVLERHSVGTFYLHDAASQLSEVELRRVCERATRILMPSPEAFHALARGAGYYPARVARRDETLPAVLDVAARDLNLDPRIARSERAPSREAPKKVLIPCSDWNVSGVNVCLEAVGEELLRLGWDLEIIFTRDEETVLGSAGDGEHLPSLPFRFLHRRRPGLDAMWEALIADLELNAPCIAFLVYDFVGNSVVSALTDAVGVVSWVQADDGDYYEQAYRLGRYCNRIVCVSRHTGDKVASLNPVVGERSRVIPNSSVWRKDVVGRRRHRGQRLRIVYTGRLVQYQKRIFDYIDLAKALDATGASYEITLIGSFSAREGIEDRFEREAAEHLADERMKLLGRCSRDQIFEALDKHDFYVLLSDFEGLPLGLIEAMARGCVPVVGPITSGIPELVSHGDNGLAAEDRDYAGWADLLLRWHRDKRGLGRLSRQARATVRERFTIERVGWQFHELFEEVAEEVSCGAFARPPALTWGPERSPTGDVLPPPSLHRPAALALPGLT